MPSERMSIPMTEDLRPMGPVKPVFPDSFPEGTTEEQASLVTEQLKAAAWMPPIRPGPRELMIRLDPVDTHSETGLHIPRKATPTGEVIALGPRLNSNPDAAWDDPGAVSPGRGTFVAFQQSGAMIVHVPNPRAGLKRLDDPLQDELNELAFAFLEPDQIICIFEAGTPLPVRRSIRVELA